MGKVKYLLGLALASVMMMAPSVYASEVKPPTVKVETAKVETPSSTSSAIKFEKEEYVRITQPALNKEGIQTFDSQINIIGEARTGTEITIIVYTGEKLEQVTEAAPNYKAYNVKKVGATQVFSQLITLSEGKNNIIIKYSYVPDEKLGSIYRTVERKSESEKEQIKSFIVDDKTNPFTTSTQTKDDPSALKTATK